MALETLDDDDEAVSDIGAPAELGSGSSLDDRHDELGDGETDADAARPSWLAAIRGSSPATWTVVLLVAAYTAYFTNRTLDIHHGLGTSSYDSGLYDQGIWLMSRFEAPFVTLMGRNLMGDHSSFVLVLLVPLYWLFPAAGTMFFAQALAIGSGAIPVYLYARRRLESDWLGATMAVAYLLHPAVSWTNMENFHPDAFLGVFIGFAIYGALERRWRVYVVSVVLSLLVKEDVSLVIVPLGVWVAVKRDRRVGILTVLGSVSFMLVAMFLVMRSLIGVPTRNSWRIPFGGPTGIIDTALRNPTQVADHFRSQGRPWYLWQMLSPTAFVFVRKWSVAAISGLVLFTNVLSTFWYQFHIQYHYSLVAVPALVMGTTYAIGSVPDRGGWRRRSLLVAVWACTVLAAYTWSPLPFAVHQPSHWPPDHPVAEAARQIVVQVPDDASVAANYRMTPHLAHRKEIYQFPNPFRIVLYGTDIAMENSRLDERADGVEFLVLQVNKSDENSADFEVIGEAFTLVTANSSWELWQRNRSVPLPPLAGP